MRHASVVAVCVCTLAVIGSGTAQAQIVMGSGPGSPPVVRVLTDSDDFTFEAYDPLFAGGVSVAFGDVTGDGTPDIITGAGPGGGPHVRVLDGTDRRELAGFFAYHPAFTGGVNVATGDVDGDGRADIITGAGRSGGPHVRVFSGADFSEIASFFAYHPAFVGGVHVAAGDVNGDGRADIVTGAGPGGGPHVNVFSGQDLSVLASFFAYNPAFIGGVAVAVGDLNGDGRSDIITGAGPGGGPHVNVFSGQDLAVLASFFAYGPAFTGGVRVAAGDIDADGRTDLITGAGPGGGPHVRVFSGVDLHEIASFFAFPGGSGVSVGSVGDRTGLRFSSPASTSFDVGVPGTFTVTTAGTPTPSLTSGGALPSGVTFVDNGDGTATLAGTPAAGTGGAYPLVFTATNGVGIPVTQSFTLTVQQPPVITSAAAVTFTTGVAGSFTVEATGFPISTLTRGGAALPAGVTFIDNGNGTGLLTGTPGAATGGVYPLTFTAANAAGTAVQTFTLTVNEAPQFLSDNSTTFAVGSPGTFSITTTGFPAVTTITRGGAALPTGVTFVDNGNGTATLSGTPAAGTTGAYPITFTITNGVGGNVVQNFTLNVQDAPAITSVSSATFTVGTPASFTVTTTGFPTPTVTHTGALPAGITFTSATRLLAGTATETGGPFQLQFTAANGVGVDAVQNFTLNVVCPAIIVTPLVMPDGFYQAAYGGVDFNQTGSSGSSFTWAATGLPAGLSIDASTGVVSGTPTDTVLNGAVIVTVTDNFGCVGTLNTSATVRPLTDNEVYSGGVGNTQFVVAGAGIATPHVFVNDNVKVGDLGPGPLSITFPATSANGAVVEGTVDGTFIYTPNLNFGGPSDSFVYTLTDGNGVTNTGTVTINLSTVVWYVNSSGGDGDGRSHNPFNTLASAAAASGSGSIIYVHSGTGPTPGNLTMDASQTLYGQGAPFAVNGLTIPAATPPTLSGTLTLANNNTVTAVNFAPSGIPAITGAGVTQPVSIDQVNVTGGTNALSLTNVTGPVTVVNASFTNASGAEVLISGGTGNVSVGATISSNAGRSIDIQNRTGGTVTFTGAITDTGQGVFLNANTGSTINFIGGLALDTGANPGFTATNGGTVNVCDENPCSPGATGGLVNTITTTTGTALHVATTTIGANMLEFRSISANGAPNGIVLSNTGAAGGLIVKGNGGSCTPAVPTCTGGRIQNTVGADSSGATPTGTGIVLNNTSNVSLSLIRLDNHSNYAIRGTSVNGFTFNSGLVDGANGTNVNTPFNDGSFVFHGVTGVSSGMTGTSSITNSTIQGGHQRNISIDNSVGTLNLTVSGNTIRRTSDAAGDDGFHLEADTTANVTVVIANNTFARHGGDHINLSLVNNAVVDATISGNALHGNYTGTPEGNHPIGLGQGIFILGATFNGTFTYDISNNGTLAVPFRGNRQGGAIHVNKGSGTGTFSGSIENNVIGDPAVTGSGSSEAFGIIVGARGAGGSHTTLIDNNLVRQYFDRGIVLEAGEGSAALNATVTNNTVSDFADAINSLHGIHSDNGILLSDTNAVCLNISGNSVATSGNEPAGGADIRVRRGSSTTVSIPGIAGTTNADATSRLQALNPAATTVTVTGNGFTNIASCQLP